MIKKFIEFVNEDTNTIFKYEGFDISIKKEGDFLVARIYKDLDEIGYISVDDLNRNPYVNYSFIKREFQKKGIGRFVYDLLEKQIGKNISHGDISSSIPAIKLWRKKLNNPSYLPDNFYEYWGDDSEDIIRELDNNI